MNTESSIGDWLRAARQRMWLSQEELADQAGLSVRTVRNLESGSVRTPHPSSMRKLSAALGLGIGAVDAGAMRRQVGGDANEAPAGRDGALPADQVRCPGQRPCPIWSTNGGFDAFPCQVHLS
jgi:transcriptional regulator with XRE-family HTH domain